jgi:tetratricopeptide (TPR) repeat protein
MKNIFTVLIFFSFLISSQAKTVQDEINTLKRKFNSEKIFEKKVDYACKISYIYLRIEPEEAKKYAEKLLQISKSEKSNKGEILGCFYLGQYYISITDYAQVHELAYKINDLGKKDNTSLAAACSASLNLVSFTRMKKIPEAKSYYETYKYFKEDKNFPPLVNILLLKSVALYLSAINEHDASYALYEKAYAIAKENEDNTEMSILKNNLGNRYLNMNMPKKAIPLLRESYNLASSIKSFKNMAYAIGSLGEAHMQLKQYDSALFYMHQSLSISNKLKINDLRMSYYEYLSNVYFEQNDYKNAYLYNRAYVQLKDSISNETTNLKISRIENRLALEKKDLQLSLIKSEKSEHQRQRNIMIVVALIAALLFVFSIIGFIRSKRANAKVKAQNKEIEIQSAILEKSRKNLFLLNEIAKKITSTTDLSKITTLVYESINQLMYATGFGFCILDNERGEIIYPYYIERGRVLYEEYRIPLSDDKKLGVICVTKKMNIIINDNAVDRVNYTDSNVVIHGDVPESLIYFPLIVNEECI